MLRGHVLRSARQQDRRYTEPAPVPRVRDSGISAASATLTRSERENREPEAMYAIYQYEFGPPETLRYE